MLTLTLSLQLKEQKCIAYVCAEHSSCIMLLWVQVDEMEKAVDVAEKNMARFNLSQAEISGRRKWVLQTRRQVCRQCPDVHNAGTPCVNSQDREARHTYSVRMKLGRGVGSPSFCLCTAHGGDCQGCTRKNQCFWTAYRVDNQGCIRKDQAVSE